MTIAAGVLGTDGLAAGSSVWAADAGEASDLDDLVHPPSWHRDAACRDRPDVSWFPDAGEDGSAA